MQSTTLLTRQRKMKTNLKEARRRRRLRLIRRERKYPMLKRNKILKLRKRVREALGLLRRDSQ